MAYSQRFMEGSSTESFPRFRPRSEKASVSALGVRQFIASLRPPSRRDSMSLTRSFSCEEHRTRCATRPHQTLYRSGSFSDGVPCGKVVPRCPGGNGEWGSLSGRLTCCFRWCSSVSADHPAAKCLTRCNVPILRDELFDRGSWKPAQYTRTLLLSGEGFNV